jgi:hypothetical protein
MGENRAMVSEVSICNQALMWLGQDAITSLQDNAKTAEWMRNNYPFIRDAVLESRMWTFATARYVSTTADMTEWGDWYVHGIPPDWLSVFRCYRQGSIYDPIPIEYRVEGGKVIVPYDTVWMWGVQGVTDTGKFTPLFVQALAARIAADAAAVFTENRQLASDMWTLSEVKLRDAAARDGQQGTSDRMRSATLVNARGVW